MARPLRTNSATFVQHVGLKGLNSQQIFYDEEDFSRFLFYLARACKKFGVALLGYALMTNHVHLVLEGDVGNFAKVFQSMGGSFVSWYNGKYERTGTIYNERYYAKPVQSLRQIVNLLIYVFRNPVAAGMVKNASSYVWSSCAETLCKDKNSIVDIKRLDELVSIAYLAQILKAKKELVDEALFHLFPKRRRNDRRVFERAKSLFSAAFIRNCAREPEERQRWLVSELIDFGANITQISRISGISRKRVMALCG